MNVAVLVNDTVGVLMGCSYTHPHTKGGLILGTGCNIAFVDEAAGQIVNSEWAGCGSARDGSETVISKLFTEADKEVDKASPNPGRQYFEKLISGFYIGEIVRRTFAKRYSHIPELQDCKPQDGGIKKMKAKHVSYIIADSTKNHLLTKEEVAGIWYLEEGKWTDEMLTELRQLCAVRNIFCLFVCSNSDCSFCVSSYRIWSNPAARRNSWARVQ
jgi:hexokinase